MSNVIELARQSGGKVWPYAKSVDFSYDELERFAALVRQEERERCAAECKFGRSSADIEIAIAIRGMKDE